MKPSAWSAASRRTRSAVPAIRRRGLPDESGRDAGGVEGLLHRRHRGLQPLEPAVRAVRDDPPQRSLRDAAAQHDLQPAAADLIQGRELTGHCGRVPQPGVEHERAQADVVGGPGCGSQGHERREAPGKIGDRDRVESGLLGPHRRLDQGIDARKGRSGKTETELKPRTGHHHHPFRMVPGACRPLAARPDDHGLALDFVYR